jgi:hypothetical protein
MRRGLVQLRWLVIVAIGIASVAACASVQRGAASSAVAGAQAPDETELGRIQSSVEAALTAEPPRGYARVPRGVRLLALRRTESGAIVLDFSRDLLNGGPGKALEDALHQIFMAASSVRAAAANRVDGYVDDYRVFIDGAALETYLR